MIKRTVNIDFLHKCGKIKPVNGANTAPICHSAPVFDFTDEYRALGIPFVALGGAGARGFLDIHNIFPDFSLDEGMELSYNFKEADELLLSVKNAGADIFLVLGESEENTVRRFTKPPQDIDKWARVCIKIIAHYNEGWAAGYKLGIKYVQLMSDVDRRRSFSGTDKEYFELYRVASTKIKERFPRIKVGAYSSGGFRSLNHVGMTDEVKSYVPYLESFLSYIGNKNTKAPLDFLSWDAYVDSPEELSLHASYAKSYLSHYGFKKASSIVSRFNFFGAERGIGFSQRDYPSKLAASLITASKTGIDMMFYSDLSPFSLENSLFSLDDRVTKRFYAPYFVMRAFGRLTSGKSTAVQTGEDYRHEIYSIAATDGERGFILLATGGYNGVIELSPQNHSYTKYSIEGMLGGGERGAGFLTCEEGQSLDGKIVLRTGKNEVYFITLE